MNTQENQVIVDQPNATFWANVGLNNELTTMKVSVNAPDFLSEGIQK